LFVLNSWPAIPFGLFFFGFSCGNGARLARHVRVVQYFSRFGAFHFSISDLRPIRLRCLAQAPDLLRGDGSPNARRSGAMGAQDEFDVPPEYSDDLVRRPVKWKLIFRAQASDDRRGRSENSWQQLLVFRGMSRPCWILGMWTPCTGDPRVAARTPVKIVRRGLGPVASRTDGGPKCRLGPA
jgi:hypothetical protein